jgi:hypothetical protein
MPRLASLCILQRQIKSELLKPDVDVLLQSLAQKRWVLKHRAFFVLNTLDSVYFGFKEPGFFELM